MPEGKYFWFRSQLNSLCLDLNEGKAEPGNHTITWEYREAPNQLWYEDQANHVIRSKLDENLVLEDNGGEVIVNSFQRGKEEQQWMLDGQRVCLRNNRDRVLHIQDGRESHAARLCVEDWSDKPEQKWEPVHLEAQYFVIISLMHGKAVDIEAGDSSPGANVIMWDHHGNENQQWYEDTYGIIRSRINGFTFNTSDGHLEMDDMHVGHSGATWVRSGDAIVNRYDPDQCIEIRDASEENVARLVQGRYYENPHQRWTFHMLE